MSQVQTTINTTWVITLLLCFFLWFLWIHRFYNWKIGTWILMIITLGWLWIWTFIDFIIILLGKFTDAENKFIKIKVPVQD